MAEIVVRPMEVKGQSQEPVRVFCENGANLYKRYWMRGFLWTMPAVEKEFVENVK